MKMEFLGSGSRPLAPWFFSALISAVGCCANFIHRVMILSLYSNWQRIIVAADEGQFMTTFEFRLGHYEKQWPSGPVSFNFTGGGNRASVVFAGGQVVGNENALVNAFGNATSLADFVQRCRDDASLTVRSSD